MNYFTFVILELNDFLDMYYLSLSLSLMCVHLSYIFLETVHIPILNAKFLQLGCREDSSIFLTFQLFIEPSIFVPSNSWILGLLAA